MAAPPRVTLTAPDLPKGSVAPLLAELDRQFLDGRGIFTGPLLDFGFLWGTDPGAATDDGDVDVQLSPTVDRFVFSDADVAMLYGPRGEGKSTAGVARIIRLSTESPEAWPVRWAVVRDTWVNVQRTLIPTLERGHRAGWWRAEFSEGRTECVLNNGLARLFLWGMDHDRDASKFQGFECGGVWLEEPAPAADMMSGIPASVLALGATSLRQSGVKHPTVQITMNPPDEDHWTMNLVDTLEESGHAVLKCEVFQIPAGENRYLPLGYRERMRNLLDAAGRQDLVRRLVEGQVGSVKVGEPVAPEFSDAHVAQDPIQICYEFPTFRFWDFGLNPTCIWAQVTPHGGLNVLGCRVGVNMGLEELIEQHVLPWEAKYGLLKMWRSANPGRDSYGNTKPGRRRMAGIRDIGDPAGYQREQSSSERSARRSLENLLRTTLEKGPVEWSTRRDAVKAVLTRMIGGRPMVQIDKDAAPLIYALRGGWRYAKYPTGRTSPEPIKDINSHPGDAFGYGVAKLWPVHELTARAATPAPFNPVPPPASAWGR